MKRFRHSSTRPRLPKAGFADDEHHPARAGDNAPQGGFDNPELDLPAHECRRGKVPPPPPRPWVGSLHVGGHDRLCLAGPRHLFGGPHSKYPSMAARVAGPTKTEHGLAPDANNDAIDTASPIAAYLAAWPTGPTTAGPVSTPMRSADPPPASWPNCIRQAARSARSGSSSCVMGAPKIASRPAPVTEVIAPPNASTWVIRLDNVSERTSFSSSGPRLLSGRSQSSAQSALISRTSSGTWPKSVTKGDGSRAGLVGTAGATPAEASSRTGEAARPRCSIALRQRSYVAVASDRRPWAE